MTLSRGIDISHHQGAVDWRALKRAHGLTWGACKATEGNTFLDSYFARNWAGLKAAGLTRMAYHFAGPDSKAKDAETEVAWFLSVVKPVTGDVLCLDLEKSPLTQGATNAWAKAFGKELRRRAPECTTVAYVGGYAANGSGAGLAPYFDYWWYPRYPTGRPVRSWPTSYVPRLSANTTGWAAPHIWQWAASLQTSEGLVDANVSTLTAAQLSAGPHRNAPDVTPQEDDMTPEQAKKLDEIHDRLYGIFPQRYYVDDNDGRAREVSADTPGAKPARGLDELHGNVIVTDIRRAVAGVTALSKMAGQQADPQAIAAAVVDAFGTDVAAQVVDAIAVRLNTKAGA
ncbi:MAG: glycoside hydrolase family 25 protein [Motilibacteraceae bacterium]